MTSGVDERTAHTPSSRAALLRAAAELFMERGYERTTVRDIGHRAGVDPALIARHFGSKEGLYLAALASDEVDAEPLAPDAVAATLLDKWERGSSPVFRALLSPTLSDEARDQVREIVGRCLAEDLEGELLVALLAGIAATRANGTLPALAGASREEILAALAPITGGRAG